MKLLNNINIDINDKSLEDVDRIDETLIIQAINKLKIGKSDCLYDFGSDAFIKPKDVLAAPIAFMFKT